MSGAPVPRALMLVRRIAVLPLLAYRKFISPLKKPTCRFTPTCSKYAFEAIMTRGVIVGSFLTVRRLLRCNPFGPFGYDPVPPRKEKIKNPPHAKEKGNNI